MYSILSTVTSPKNWDMCLTLHVETEYDTKKKTDAQKM